MTSKQQTDDFSDIAQPASSGDDFADIAARPPDLATLTANPADKKTGKGQGTYRMLPPIGQDAQYGKTGVMVPYGNVRLARQSGFNFDPKNSDSTRYAQDLFTDLQNNGLIRSLDSISDSDAEAEFGVVPTPAPGTKEWFRRKAIKAGHGVTESLPTIGAIGGGIATGVPGAATGPADIAIAGAGAAAGAGLGEDARQVVNEKVFHEPRQTGKQAALNLGTQAALGFGQEVGGRYAAKPLGWAAKQLGITADESEKAGVRLLPSEALGKAPTWIENFLKGSVATGGMMEKFRELQNKESAAAVDRLMTSVSKFKGTPEQLGKMVQKGLDDATDVFRAEQNALYGDLDKLANEKWVSVQTPVQEPILNAQGKPLLDAAGRPMTKTVMKTSQVLQSNAMPSMVPLKNFARQKLSELAMPPNMLPKSVLEEYRSYFNAILDNPDHVSFKSMGRTRSQLLSMGRKLDEMLGGAEAGLIKKLTGLADQSMEDAAKNSTVPDLYTKWRAANAFTAEGHRMFEQKLVEKAAEIGDPEFVASLLGGNKIGLQQTRDLFKALPRRLHDPVRRGLLQDAFDKAADLRTGEFDEGKFTRYIDKIGDERAKIVFGPHWKAVKEMADLLAKINGPVGMARGGGASLQNVGILKRIASAGLSVPGDVLFYLGTAGVTAGRISVLHTALSIGGELAAYRAIAWSMVNPRAASKMLEVARVAAHNLPYAAHLGYNMAEASDKTRAEEMLSGARQRAEKLRQFVTKKPGAIEAPVAAPPAAPAGAPAASGPISYQFNYVNPAGHRIGSNDGQTWFDKQTGQQVA